MNMPTMSNWRAWNSGKGGDVLDDRALVAENRLNAIKKSAKIFKKSVEESLKTNPGKNDDLDSRKKRTAEMALGDHIAAAVNALNEEKASIQYPPPPPTPPAEQAGQTSQLYPSLPAGQASALPASMSSTPASAAAPGAFISPLTTLLERFANLEKTLGHMVATSEAEIFQFVQSDTPISLLLNQEIPGVTQSKEVLDKAMKKQHNCQTTLEKEEKKCEKLRHLDDLPDQEVLDAAEEKRERLSYELDNAKKDVALEKDRLSSTLLTLVSRENRYAQSVLELMRLKKAFYENAFRTIEAELPYVERLLQETTMRPVFGEPLEAHLRATKRSIAYPIAIAVSFLRETELNDEGLFRISAKQIKVDKFKAGLDSHQPLSEVLPDADDPHLLAALLKSYLRELPEPLLGGGPVYQQWIDAVKLPDPNRRLDAMRRILNEDVSMDHYRNIQYIIDFLAELTDKSDETKMTARNLAIVIGPTLLWRHDGVSTQLTSKDNMVAAASYESAAVESVILVVVTLIENAAVLFPEDLPEDLEADVRDAVRDIVLCQRTADADLNAAHRSRHLQVPARGVDGGSSSSPNHKRKASIRSMGRNFIAKINSGGSSHPASKTPSPKEDHRGGEEASQ